MENRHYLITRCPHCNSADLTAIYQKPPEKRGLFAWCFKWSIFGLIKYLLGMRKENEKIAQNTYWQCNRCGATFADQNIGG